MKGIKVLLLFLFSLLSYLLVGQRCQNKIDLIDLLYKEMIKDIPDLKVRKIFLGDSLYTKPTYRRYDRYRNSESWFTSEKPHRIMSDSLQDGIYDVYSNVNKSYKIARCQYINNQRAGLWISYYPNGRVHEKKLLGNIPDYKHISYSYNHLGQLLLKRFYGKDSSKDSKFINNDVINYGERGTWEDNDHFYYGTPSYNIFLDLNSNKAVDLPEAERVLYKRGRYVRNFQDTEDVIYKTGDYGTNNYYTQRFSDSIVRRSNKDLTYRVITQTNSDTDYLTQITDTNHVFYTKIPWWHPRSMELGKYRDIPFNHFPNLRVFEFYQENNSQAFLLNDIDKLSNLEYIRYAVKDDSISIPKSIFKCKNLKYLKLENMNLNEFPKEIQELKKLEVLILNFPHGEIDNLISLIYQLPKLKVLYINSISESSPPIKLHLLKDLEELSLFSSFSAKRDTNFYLPINEIKQLKKMKYLVVLGNYREIYNSLLESNPDCMISKPGFGCFAGGTLIQQPDNKFTAIENLKVGDILLAYNEEEKSLDTTIVTKTFVHEKQDDNCLNIAIKSRDKTITLQVTINHPFYTKEKHWVPAGELTTDMNVLLLDSSTGKSSFVKISSITPLEEDLTTVYNIETSRHNYFAQSILVHNK